LQQLKIRYILRRVYT